MANPHPDASKARLEKRRKRRPKPGSVRQLTAVLWAGINRLEDALNEIKNEPLVPGGRGYGADDIALICKLTHALSQSASTYLKAVEVGELEARVEALEQAQAAQERTLRRAA